MAVKRTTQQAENYRELNRQLVSRLPQAVTTDLTSTSITYLHCLKVSRVLRSEPRLHALLDCSPAEYGAIQPILQHLLAMTYRGDLTIEEGQRTSSELETHWRQGVECVLSLHGVLDQETRDALDDLALFFERESRVMAPTGRPSPAEVAALLRLRSADLRIVLRVACKLLGRPVSEDFMQLVEGMQVLAEISDDLRSYEQDVREGSFNTLRLYAQLFPVSQAASELNRTRERYVEQTVNSLQQATRPSIIRFQRFLTAPAASSHWNYAPRVLLARRARNLLRQSWLWEDIPQPIEEERWWVDEPSTPRSRLR
ncbi:hypothetical protein [Streptomyces smyrnaeus]|uniref:hypothetical protein n=1 Tax=Streptomyces smyrnaeus TaxID=1387713 RepID=UPI0033F2F42D